ncbi:MAG: DUF427 domain-containing protein [Geodermatophilaceae bacterium]|nr:DUF427 domain-containing protein [Geodermatophilaceae bacterium]
MSPARRVAPGPGQESVWDYPRPPSLQRSVRRIVIRLAGRTILDTSGSWRVCETSHPPVYYVAPEDFEPGKLSPGNGSSYCEFKGAATYWHVGGGHNAGWSYENPTPAFAPMRGAVAVYPGQMDEVLLDGEPVMPQAGGFYGGWITSEVVGPFKGEPGTRGW